MAATHTWVFDAPTGTYKNHAMSSSIFEASIAETIAMDFVNPVDGYGRKRGESVTLNRVSNVTEPTSATLSETQRIPEDEFDITNTSITVAEIGRAIPFTSLADDLGQHDMETAIQKELRKQMSLYLDSLALAAFKSCKHKYIPTGATAATWDTDGTASTACTANMNMYHVEEIRDYMFDTMHVPPYEGGDYIGIFRTKGLRGVKRDPDWEDWHKYTDPAAKFNSEVGRMEQIRFLETNHGGSAVTAAGLNAGTYLGEGVVFGDDAVAMAEAVTPELRVALPQDFGRAQAVAWYGVLAFGIIWDTNNAGEAKVVHVTGTTI